MDLEAMGFDFTAGLDCPPFREESRVPDCSKIINELEQASVEGDLRVIKLAFATLRSIPGCDIYLKRPGSSLFFAIENRHDKIVKLFLNEGVKLETNHAKIATIDKNILLLEMFLHYDWDINEQLDWAIPPPLGLAIEDERTASWFLAHGADPNSACLSGLTPLSTALEYAKFDVIKLLFNCGGSAKSRNLIHHAARRDADDRLYVLDYILKRGGRANINHVMYDDEPLRYKLQEALGLRTPLHEAAGHGHIEIVRMLVGNGADPRIGDSRGKTVIQRARWWKHVQIVEYLQSLGVLE